MINIYVSGYSNLEENEITLMHHDIKELLNTNEFAICHYETYNNLEGFISTLNNTIKNADYIYLSNEWYKNKYARLEEMCATTLGIPILNNRKMYNDDFYKNCIKSYFSELLLEENKEDLTIEEFILSEFSKYEGMKLEYLKDYSKKKISPEEALYEISIQYGISIPEYHINMEIKDIVEDILKEKIYTLSYKYIDNIEVDFEEFEDRFNLSKEEFESILNNSIKACKILGINNIKVTNNNTIYIISKPSNYIKKLSPKGLKSFSKAINKLFKK